MQRGDASSLQLAEGVPLNEEITLWPSSYPLDRFTAPLQGLRLIAPRRTPGAGGERVVEHIERAFERDCVLGDYDLDADAEGEKTGFIELEGRDKAKAHRERAHSIAHRIGPNFRIVNKIKVDRTGFMGGTVTRGSLEGALRSYKTL